MVNKKKIFLSHRFTDKVIADTVRRHFCIWGFDNEIYQASAPGLGPKAGKYITEEIKEALFQAKLVILIYTLKDDDWTFCMWECGLATNPKDSDTRTIVLQCNPFDSPRTFEGQLAVKVDKDSIKNFIIQFHKEDNFFPGEPAYRPNITDETIQDLSNSFYNDLITVIPPGRLEERYRWDFLTLEINRNDVTKIKDMKDPIELFETCLAVKDFGEALKHFGYANLEPDLKLSDLAKRWKDRTKDRKDVSDNWIKELRAEIFRAIDNSPANPEWASLNSVNYPGSWFYPVINHVRVLADSSMQFELYFYRSLSSKDKIIE